MSLGRASRLSCLSFGVLCLLLGRDASAMDRRGYLFGFSLGGGTFSADTRAGSTGHRSFALDLHTGTGITRNVAILFDGWALGSLEEDDADEAPIVGVDTVAVQVWPTSRLWLKGGLGLGEYLPPVGDTQYGLGAMAAVGCELAQGDRFALDLAARGGLVESDSQTHKMFSINLGLNWY